ncbi:MAG: hypothetical protein E5W82_10160 [Mesorhizobium sp.]|nr:MAG: hypothetical protein E5W82_10160 [Mesorhizobium sp.]
MTPAEQEVLIALVNAWNKFVDLPIEHGDDLTEFRHGIHSLQHIVLMRPTRRAVRMKDYA